MHTHTTSYALLEVSKETMDDIRARLKLAGELNEYQLFDIGERERLVMNGIALVEEKTRQSTQKSVK